MCQRITLHKRFSKILLVSRKVRPKVRLIICRLESQPAPELLMWTLHVGQNDKTKTQFAKCLPTAVALGLASLGWPDVPLSWSGFAGLARITRWCAASSMSSIPSDSARCFSHTRDFQDDLKRHKNHGFDVRLQTMLYADSNIAGETRDNERNPL